MKDFAQRAEENGAVLTGAQNAYVRLIVNRVHDSQVMTGNLLRALMSFSKDSRAFNLSDVAEDSDPVAYTSM